MPLYINTNVGSLNAQRSLLGSTTELNKVFARLSSGLRINTAGDDAAGLAISNRMTAQIRGLSTSIRNANDGISVSQVAEGALSETTNMLQRINELAVQAANGTNSDKDRTSLQEEVNQLLAEIERIAQETEFNNWAVLNGQTDPLVFQTGARENQTIVVNLADARAETLLAQPQVADPNSPEGIHNPKIEGLSITAPSSQLEGSRLFSSEASAMVHVLANASPSTTTLGTSDPANVASNMFTVIDNASATTNAATLVTAVGADTGTTTLTTYAATSPSTSDTLAFVTALLTGLGDDGTDAAEFNTKIGSGITSGFSAAQIVSSLTLAGTVNTATQQLGVVSSTMALMGYTADSGTKIAGGGTMDNAIAAWLGSTTVTDATVDSDQARVVAAATYAANKAYTATENVPSTYQTLAGDTTGSIATAGTTANVVDNAINGTAPMVDDVPVGNILEVIKAFDGGVSLNKDIETIAKAAVDADASKRLTMDDAKIIAAAGLAAAAPDGSVTKAATAAKNMALVLASRDAAAAAASEPEGGETLTVPKWLLDVSGSNTFPPSPLIDLTGATIPTDPTLPFNPPATNSSNPPLSGQEAAGRMISYVLNGLDRVNSTRAELGAIESRFESTIKNLSSVVENVSAARSRIMDADIAEETANLTRLAIMQQAGTAILAQANQQPQLALQLLG